ncbi:MAG: RnfABCDGE type electron transport complex subunit D [Erysipelotrichaceae bacterium]|nr:RnfABCDGE type electron transport complex subunit D [Erysipelotrichaceae bacterium]
MKVTLQRTSPNYRQKLSTQRIMRDLTIALLVIVAYTLFYYYNYLSNDPFIQVALMFVVSLVVAFATEIVWAYMHKQKIFDYLKSSFPWVTAIILVLTLPIGTPLYVVGVSSFVAIFLGKLVYGGFGQNIFNPALVGRVVAHLAFSSDLIATATPSGVDVSSSATPITMMAATNWLGGDSFTYSLSDLFFGSHTGALGETCVILLLVLGIVMILRKVIDARIPVSYLLTIVILSEVFAVINGLDLLTYPLYHLCLGGLMFGAFFMATDPVTSPTSPQGKIIYGVGLGFLTMIIRLKANYPEGVLFSILIMNMLTPLIDSLILGRTDTKIAQKWLSIVAVLAVAIVCVAGIGFTIKSEVEAEELAAKEAEEEAAREAEEAANQADWTYVETTDDGYVMEVSGFSSSNKMKVAVQIDGDTITSVKVLEYAGETDGYGKDLIENGEVPNDSSKADVASAFVEAVFGGNLSSSDIDDIEVSTGATKTSTGIINAIKGALEQAEIGG